MKLARRCQAVDEAFAAYHHLVELGIPAEDARYLLPNACETKITVTMNIRELLHFFNLRCCNRAQWEIRAMAQKMLELVRPTAPYIFLDAGPSCVRGSCPEGRMSCGNPSPIVSRKDFDAALKAAASHASDERATVESDE